MTSTSYNDYGNGGSGGGSGGGGGPRRSKFGRFGPKRREVEPEEPLDYKNIGYLAKFVSPNGRILSRKRTGFSGQNQRKLARAIKNARIETQPAGANGESDFANADDKLDTNGGVNDVPDETGPDGFFEGPDTAFGGAAHAEAFERPGPAGASSTTSAGSQCRTTRCALV